MRLVIVSSLVEGFGIHGQRFVLLAGHAQFLSLLYEVFGAAGLGSLFSGRLLRKCKQTEQ
jgi:hypothetical protein